MLVRTKERIHNASIYKIEDVIVIDYDSIIGPCKLMH